MNSRDIKKLTDFLKGVKQLGQLKKLTELLKQIRLLKAMQNDSDRREWVREHEDLFQGLKPEDWAWLKEKADYDEEAWKKMVRTLTEGDPQP